MSAISSTSALAELLHRAGDVPRERIVFDPVPDWAPNLAIEVLGKSNTRDEMKRKWKEYLDAGMESVWHVDPDQRCIEEFSGVDEELTLRDGAVLTGGTVLPGFQASVQRVLDAGQMRRPES